MPAAESAALPRPGVVAGAPSRAPRVVRVVIGTCTALLIAYALQLVFELGGRSLADFFSTWVYNAVILVAAALCLGRGAACASERSAWLLLGGGLAAWSAGESYFSVVLADLEPTPYPSLSDALMLLFYPAVYLGLAQLLRARLTAVDRSLWLDGLIAALAAGALAAALWLAPITAAIDRDPLVALTSLAYPVGDLVLFGLVAGSAALIDWRPDRAWALLGIGLLTAVAADVVFVVESARNGYVEGTLLDALWPAAALTLAAGAWAPPSAGRRVRLAGRRLMVVPSLLSSVALVLLVLNEFSPVGRVAVALATATLFAAILRMAASVYEHQREIDARRREARVDPLTGLHNRRALLEDLDKAFAEPSPEGPLRLTLLDLDGFKEYNDAFGHPAGDRLLARLGEELLAAVRGHGRAYRLGGDEFCVLMPESLAADGLVAASFDGLASDPRTATVGVSVGHVRLPEEGADVSTALRIADRRLYQAKGRRTTSPVGPATPSRPRRTTAILAGE